MNAQFAHIIKPVHIVAYVLKVKDGQSSYLLIRRSSKILNGNWQMVSGGIHTGETAWQAALREIKEETNLIPDRFYSADAVECFYEVSRDIVMIGPAFVAFIDTEQEVKLSPKEHDLYKWVSYDEALTYLEFENQQRIIKQIEDNFVKKPPKERFRIK